MAVRVGESNKIIRVSSSGYDMTAYTELKLNFTAPGSGTSFEVDTSGNVSLGTSSITDDDLGALNANEYVEFLTSASTFDSAGDWVVCLEYQDNTTSPTTIYLGADADLEVLEGC